MKLRILLFPILLLSSIVVIAEETHAMQMQDDKVQTPDLQAKSLQAKKAQEAHYSRAYASQSNSADEIADIILLRPLGIATTLVGTGIFIAISPLTLIATIPRPHTAFNSSLDVLIMGPFNNTFRRPLGQMDYDGSGLY